MSKDAAGPIEVRVSSTARIAIVAARFNEAFVNELLDGCIARLEELKIDRARIEIHRVPGAFELPLAAKLLARSGKFAAVICLGCIIRGDTPHFDFVAGECARGIQETALRTDIPIIFGVLTTENIEQARQRLGGAHGHAGRRAAEAAAEMIALLDKIKS